MQKSESRFTVYFDDPFWVGVYERVSDGRLEVCKVTFGAEPKDYEVYDFLLRNWHLLRFGLPVPSGGGIPDTKMNPKRMQRAIKNQLERPGVGTKSQQVLKLQHEENKAAHKARIRQRRDEEKQLQFELHQQKKKQKHKGH